MRKYFSQAINSKSLFKPIKLGSYELKNRIAMAAMTRCRADPKLGVPTDLHKKYYSERAEHSGLVLTECSAISHVSNAFPGSCGIWNEDQIQGWNSVVEKVHEVKGRIFLQVFHGGRACNKNYSGETNVAPSAVPIRSLGKNKEIVYGDIPRELKEEEIIKIVDQFKFAAENALKAGFDGVQLHGANGYLIDEFLRDCTNQRNDKYGGNVENRCRFPLLVIDALISVMGPEKVGIKVSPCGRYNDMYDSNPLNLYSYLFKELSTRKISFIELFRGSEPGQNSFYKVKAEEQLSDTLKLLRPFFDGILMGNNSFSYEEANELIDQGVVDMVSFGKKFVGNPDLPLRFINDWPLNNLSIRHLYGGGSEGYTSYSRYDPESKL